MAPALGSIRTHGLRDHRNERGVSPQSMRFIAKDTQFAYRRKKGIILSRA